LHFAELQSKQSLQELTQKKEFHKDVHSYKYNATRKNKSDVHYLASLFFINTGYSIKEFLVQYRVADIYMHAKKTGHKN